ncbi:loader of DNA helicase [Aeromonas phage phiAS5]|uniref:Loader of DNA helicase n=1 Tax=Aeromonas phage phiAS5 TaxID=879630 RepID=E1A2K4_9CAUD|nr:loader of DNA helicase [Aeromonas phage phiAS5]ADM79950.1 loader of DNA helicase [Aeromonas phage phiAS5]
MIELILPPKPKMTVNGISVYRLFLTLKNHFAGKYDIVKYQWTPIRATEQSFVKHRSRAIFERLATKFTLGELAAIMTVNFAANPDAWGGDIANADAVTFYRTALGRYEQMSTVFKEEVEQMFYFARKKNMKFKELIYSTNGQPWIFKFVQTGTISYETMIILDALFNFVDSYDKLDDHVWANGYASRIKAYRMLTRINKEQAKACFIEIANQNKLS